MVGASRLWPRVRAHLLLSAPGELRNGRPRVSLGARSWLAFLPCAPCLLDTVSQQRYFGGSCRESRGKRWKALT